MNMALQKAGSIADNLLATGHFLDIPPMLAFILRRISIRPVNTGWQSVGQTPPSAHMMWGDDDICGNSKNKSAYISAGHLSYDIEGYFAGWRKPIVAELPYNILLDIASPTF